MTNTLTKFQQFEVSGNKISGADYACYSEVTGNDYYIESDANASGDYFVVPSPVGDGNIYCTAVY